MISEKSLEKVFTDRARLIGGMSRKFVSPGYSGVPDRLLFIKGLVFPAEIKTSGEKPTPRQRFVHREFAANGFPVWIIDDKVSLDAFFEHVKQKINESHIS